ncbi:hypothetical protein [uncultured Roseobacter sp.]|uniref:hypothetical protein n=1 Tax=uncultured Roseobacter sp. TaxID=114847 RepID=UPI002610D978|nr:hypothetical protein [uncultured Roseobacter sp.]
MSVNAATEPGTAVDDPDVAAIQKLISAERVVDAEPDGPGGAADVTVPEPRSVLRRMSGRALTSIRTYRPDRKSILLTSLVLLTLLWPHLIIGSVLISVLSLLAAYFVMGHEVFWRRALGCFSLFQRVAPQTGRKLRARLWLGARKWARLTGLLPESFARRLQLPDLRAIAGARDRHDAVLSERLSRL